MPAHKCVSGGITFTLVTMTTSFLLCECNRMMVDTGILIIEGQQSPCAQTFSIPDIGGKFLRTLTFLPFPVPSLVTLLGYGWNSEMKGSSTCALGLD